MGNSQWNSFCVGVSGANRLFKYINRCRILDCIHIQNQNFKSITTLYRKLIKKFLGRIGLNFAVTKVFAKFRFEWYIWPLFDAKMSHKPEILKNVLWRMIHVRKLLLRVLKSKTLFFSITRTLVSCIDFNIWEAEIASIAAGELHWGFYRSGVHISKNWKT